MKLVLICLSILFLRFSLFSQDYVLDCPQNWRTEVMQLPLDFAPEINVFGVEDIRFAPGWANETENDFWTYKFVWMLDSIIVVNDSIMKNYLAMYFDGLIKAVGNSKGLDISKIAPTNVNLTKNGTNTLIGKVDFWDVFFKQERVHLNSKIESIYCQRLEKQIIIFEFSPHQLNHKIWQELNNIDIVINCE